MRAAPGVHLVVLAKAPRPGRVKTRLCPPCTPEGAARIAAAALADTIAAVTAAPAVRRTLVVDGAFPAPPGWSVRAQRGAGLGERLAHAFADCALPGVPTLLIGMDTPQVTPAALAAAAELLGRADAALGPAADLLGKLHAVPAHAPGKVDAAHAPGKVDAAHAPGKVDAAHAPGKVDAAHAPGQVDAVLGPAADGGWWALGLRDPAAAAVLPGVPMSTAETGARTRAALVARGLRVAPLPGLRDVDTAADAWAVAAECAPGSRFAAAVPALVPAGPRTDAGATRAVPA